MAKNKPNPSPPVDYEAFSAVAIPTDLVYMPNVLRTFVHSIPPECHVYCTSRKHPSVNVAALLPADRATDGVPLSMGQGAVSYVDG